jgi:hypothetical protein
MPWYWSDDIARALLEGGKIRTADALLMSATPVAYRSEAATLAEAVEALLDDEEVPLAA